MASLLPPGAPPFFPPPSGAPERGAGLLYEFLLPVHSTERADQARFRSQLIAILKVQEEYAVPLPLGELWALLNSSHSSIDDCVVLLELDAFLSARVIHVANVTVASQRREISTVAAAVLRLGFCRVRQITFNAGVYRQFSKYRLPEGWEQFWRRSLFVARVTQRIAAGYMRTDGSEYIAGLLKDVGWLVLARFFPGEFAAVFHAARPVAEMEQELFSNTHTEISATICARALLSDRLVEAVLTHPAPLLRNTCRTLEPAKSAELLAVILHLAHRLADCAGLRIVASPEETVKELQQSAEARWLSVFGPCPALASILEEELRQTDELYPGFFANATLG